MMEKSCGAVVFTKKKGKIYYLLVRSLGYVYGFPKGHMEANESEHETALREIKEETNLDVTFHADFRATTVYALPSKGNILKEVVFFLASYENQTPIPQKTELISASLHTYENALQLLQHDSLREILTQANDCLQKK